MDYVAPSTTNRWLPIGRLVLAAVGQYILILVLGTLLWVLLSASLSDTNGEQVNFVEEIEKLLGTLGFVTYLALWLSWPAFLVLFATLAGLRRYGPRRPAWQRWAWLLMGVTLGAFLPVPTLQEAGSEFVDVNWFWALKTCRSWILAAYLVTLWANRSYLRSAFPSSSQTSHAPAPPAI
ncbi:hypothetical protein [Hymenobacter metallicola]|uniref:DUF2569 family protein n=1 Tax=Hymenobacter metallicola TaxID=2563114 RepID=A0A4Z0Q006_9BACT|nr:hypothetical protein [Hymenobacter metallicola]TGE22894.1 hypothetical protein E5K02_21260 [Hymenobacter metallicola]